MRKLITTWENISLDLALIPSQSTSFHERDDNRVLHLNIFIMPRNCRSSSVEYYLAWYYENVHRANCTTTTSYSPLHYVVGDIRDFLPPKRYILAANLSGGVSRVLPRTVCLITQNKNSRSLEHRSSLTNSRAYILVIESQLRKSAKAIFIITYYSWCNIFRFTNCIFIFLAEFHTERIFYCICSRVYYMLTHVSQRKSRRSGYTTAY